MAVSVLPAVPEFFIENHIKKEVEIAIRIEDIIILSQTCDIVHKKINSVLSAKVIPLSVYLENKSKKERLSAIKLLKERARPGYVLLRFGYFKEYSWIVVDFHELYVLPLDSNFSNCREMYRIKEPYREYLSQNFGNYMMRVALPQDLNEESILSELTDQ